MTKQSREHWKTIPGTGGFYEASNKGRVRSVGMRINGYKPRVLKTPAVTIGNYRYPVFGISLSGVIKRHYVCRAVWSAWRGKIPKGAVILHKNGDLKDNRIANLKIGTRVEAAKIRRQSALHSSGGSH